MINLLNAWASLLLGGSALAFVLDLVLVYHLRGARPQAPRVWGVLHPLARYNRYALGTLFLYFALRRFTMPPAQPITTDLGVLMIVALMVVFLVLLSALLMPAVLLWLEVHPFVWRPSRVSARRDSDPEKSRRRRRGDLRDTRLHSRPLGGSILLVVMAFCIVGILYVVGTSAPALPPSGTSTTAEPPTGLEAPAVRFLPDTCS